MKIRPKIPIFLGGGPFDNLNTNYLNWYNTLWNENARVLGNTPLSKRYDKWGKPAGYDTHHQTDDLKSAAWSNYNYTLNSNKNNVRNDILYYLDNSGIKYTSPEDFVLKYNNNIDYIFNTQNKLYNYNMKDSSWRNFNKNYNLTYHSKGSGEGLSTLLYDPTTEQYRGTTTHARRPDLYETEFDKLSDDEKWDRIHKINLNGKEVYVAKEANGHLRLLPNINEPSPNDPQITKQEDPNKEEKVNEIDVGHKENGYGFDWNKITQGLLQMLPGMLEAGRLAGSLYSNARIYDAKLKGIRPNLVLPYSTHRQVVGDEATKQAYYRRGAQGMTRAALPFTSDADKQMAYMMEAKRASDELLALGDIADNLEIRRTSDESNLHLWANTERYTRAANENIALLNYANAAKLDLIAQQHAANWSSWDNYLKSKEYRLRQRQAEALALDDEIFALTENYELLSDPELNAAKLNLENVIKKHTSKDNNTDWNNLEVLNAQKIYQLAQRRAGIRSINRRKLHMSNRYISLAATGTKITRKRKDDLLYKSARDVVEHFRKMSKMSDDSTQRSRPRRIFDLNSHPGGRTRKMQQGGVAPFTVFTPVALGGETSTQVSSAGASTSSKKSSDSEGKETLDLMKSLFLKMEGLPIDVNTVYKQMANFLGRAKAFGNELSTNDIASMYLQSMLQLSNLKYSQDVYNKAKAVATNNDALSEFAVTATGHYIVQDKDGNFSEEKTWKDVLESGKNPVTNLQLLNLRAYSPNLVFGHGDAMIENVINNGMGINKIGALIKALAGNLGESESKIEGLTQVESGKVKSGLLILANAPDGYYKYTKNNKNQQEQVNAALKYIENMLSPSQKAILETHGGTRPNIAHFLSSQTDTTEELTISPLTGKASDKGSGSGDGDMLPSVAFFNGLGEKDSFIIQDKTNDGLKIDVVSTPITSKGYNTGSITFDKLESSDFGGQLLMNQATMGDSLISSTGRNNIIIDGRIYLAELPIDQEAKRTTGIIKPDLKFLKKIEIADTKLRQMGIDKSDPKNIAIVNKVYLENNLPILYTISNNKPIITSDYARFAIVNGVGTEEAFGDNSEFNDGILEISSDKERQQFETMMQLLGNTKYKLDNGYGIGPLSWGETKLYKGTIYIPMATSNISALAGTGFKAKGEEYNEIEARQLAADAARNKGFIPAGDASNFK